MISLDGVVGIGSFSASILFGTITWYGKKPFLYVTKRSFHFTWLYLIINIELSGPYRKPRKRGKA